MMIRKWLAAGLVVCAPMAAVGPASAQVPMGGSGGATTTLATIASSGPTQNLAFAAMGNAAYDITLTAHLPAERRSGWAVPVHDPVAA